MIGSSSYRARSTASARSGRDVTSWWPDLAASAMKFRPGIVIDGEAVVYVGGRIDFGAAQSRRATTPSRARRLANQVPAAYAAFDLLDHPELGDIRPRPWAERRALLLDVFEDQEPPLQVVPTTNDRELAEAWYQVLPEQGIEGPGLEAEAGAVPGGRRDWRKQRHSDTVDAPVVGYTGPPARPRTVAVQLPDGRTAPSQALTAPLAAAISEHLARSGPAHSARTSAGATYSTTSEGLVVEVLAGTTRHAVVTVTRLR
ncbi:DNA ligase [Streptomyces sp. NPDC005065]|uniref:ATP-dependent DNA ligase n=1 Tax=unclassified Streptomyces TaxID=2593676 RepID=UPI0033BEDE7B